MNQPYIYTIMSDGIPAIWEFEVDHSMTKTMLFCRTFNESDEVKRRLNLNGYISDISLEKLHEFARYYNCLVMYGQVVNGFLEFQQRLEMDE